MNSPIIVALDTPNLAHAQALAESLDPELCRLKVGKELFTSAGTLAVQILQRQGFEIFLDLKFHDIPNTTVQAVQAAADLGVWLTNVHASVGESTMKKCKECLSANGYATKLIAVTVLTSMTDDDLTALGIARTPAEQVAFLAQLTYQAGLDGVVCSAQEAAMLQEKFGRDFLKVTPGIRLADGGSDDQARICTPSKARALGADFLVIGRPITQADRPNDVLRQILASLA